MSVRKQVSTAQKFVTKNNHWLYYNKGNSSLSDICRFPANKWRCGGLKAKDDLEAETAVTRWLRTKDACCSKQKILLTFDIEYRNKLTPIFRSNMLWPPFGLNVFFYNYTLKWFEWECGYIRGYFDLISSTIKIETACCTEDRFNVQLNTSSDPEGIKSEENFKL